LFYQHNPYGWNWGNMHWGHAVSTDLMHWRELPEALVPREYGDWCFSGSAVVDEHNTSGWQQGDEPPLVAAFTSTGRGECIVHSHDRGRTWTEFEGNPVVRHAGRDPRLLWHEPTERWVMAVYDEHAGGRWIAFYTSSNLREWEFQSRTEDFFECPDLFAISDDREPPGTHWVLYAADGRYVLGDFDGREFRPRTEKLQLWHGNFYAAQTCSQAPQGRRVQIGWANGVVFPGMPFNQQMTVPVELRLRSTDDGPRLTAEPVAELAALRGEPIRLADVPLGERRVVEQVAGPAFDLELELGLGQAQQITLHVGGVPIVYDVQQQTLACAPVKATVASDAGRLKLRVLVDRGSIEIFAQGGRVALSVACRPEADRALELQAAGEGAKLVSLSAWPLNSIWP
jgi:fructan beta-fructosidase